MSCPPTRPRQPSFSFSFSFLDLLLFWGNISKAKYISNIGVAKNNRILTGIISLQYFLSWLFCTYLVFYIFDQIFYATICFILVGITILFTSKSRSLSGLPGTATGFTWQTTVFHFPSTFCQLEAPPGGERTTELITNHDPIRWKGTRHMPSIPSSLCQMSQLQQDWPSLPDVSLCLQLKLPQ